MLADSLFENDVPSIQQELDDPVLEMSIDFDKKNKGPETRTRYNSQARKLTNRNKEDSK
jgi:hypothetical protein